jgi:CysZ protein
MRQFAQGVALLGRGFAYWRRRPGTMALGLVPAAIVAALFVSGLIALGVFLPEITEAATPFADAWPALWARAIRFAVGAAAFGGALVVAVVSFTALTLFIGEPFYDRIWRSVESDLGQSAIDADYGFWRSVADTLTLLARGLGVAVAAALIGLIPVVGGALGTIFAVSFTGLLLTDELTARALTARGISRPARRQLMRRHRARVLGFGVATQLCFLIPFGAVATMPAAVAGSTGLARELVERRPATPPAAG